MGPDLFRHAHPCIAHREHRVAPRYYCDDAGRIVFIQIHHRRFQCQRATLRHGIAGIHRQVHDHLFHLPAIGTHQPRLRAAGNLQFDIFAQQPMQHGRHVSHHRVQIHDLGCQHLAATEGQQLSRECRGAVRALLDLVNMLRRPFRLGDISHQHLAVAMDDGQQIVEIVRYPAGQPPDSLHLLRLPQFIFQALALADIHDCADQPLRAPAFIAHYPAFVPYLHVAAVARAEAVFQKEIGFVFQRFRQLALGARQIVGVNARFPPGAAGGNLVQRIAEDLAQSARPGNALFAQIGFVNHRVGRGAGDFEALVGAL